MGVNGEEGLSQEAREVSKALVKLKSHRAQPAHSVHPRHTRSVSRTSAFLQPREALL